MADRPTLTMRDAADAARKQLATTGTLSHALALRILGDPSEGVTIQCGERPSRRLMQTQDASALLPHDKR